METRSFLEKNFPSLFPTDVGLETRGYNIIVSQLLADIEEVSLSAASGILQCTNCGLYVMTLIPIEVKSEQGKRPTGRQVETV